MNISAPREPDLIQRAWPINEQPMARLLAHGPAALSDAEILAVLLRKGDKDKSAVEVAREVLKHAGGIAALLCSANSSMLGLEAQARLTAALELARRGLREQLSQTDALSSPTTVRDYLRLALSGKEHEVFVVVLLDAQNRVLYCEELFRGTLTQTSVYPREVVKAALKANAAAVIFAHNHPSGVAEPSHADEVLTQALKQALALVDIKVLDHFIVAGGSALSFAERGLI
jgi:DNA repair protein RadC